MTAGYRSGVTGGAGGVSLRAAGEQHAHVGQDWLGIVVPAGSGIEKNLITMKQKR